MFKTLRLDTVIAPSLMAQRYVPPKCGGFLILLQRLESAKILGGHYYVGKVFKMIEKLSHEYTTYWR